MSAVVRIPVLGPTTTVTLEGLAALQGAVGGLIEFHDVDEHLTLIFDEEGKLKGKPLNRAATIMSGLWEWGDYLVGDVLLAAQRGSELVDDPDLYRKAAALLDDRLQKYLRHLAALRGQRR